MVATQAQVNALKRELARSKAIADRAIAAYLAVGVQPTLRAAMAHLPLKGGGKRLRVALPMLVAQAAGGRGARRRVLPFGCALELIHNFTLVHDDIMDHAQLRRKIQTVHKVWDGPTAINAGDALFARAFEVLVELDVEPKLGVEIIGRVARMVRQVGEGQQWDMEYERKEDVTPAQVIRMIERKTALMFSTGAYGAARIAGLPPVKARRLEAYGRLLGIGFQVQDDVIDLLTPAEDSGKRRGGDIANGKRTLIALDAIESLKGNEHEEFESIFGSRTTDEARLERAISLAERCGAIARATATARRYAKDARAKLSVLPRSPARKHLEVLADYVVLRTF